ncbi:MAG TPA: hypothetical protein VM686_15835 [Polyangiaceae bacterium]|nr:hypothetical protein [Polyangiaceae bacterium]
MPSPRLAGALAFYAQFLSAPQADAQPEPPPATAPAEPVAPPAAAAPAAPAAEAAPAPRAEPAPAPAPEAAEAEKPKEKKDKNGKKKSRFEIDGRLIARAELARREADLVTASGIDETHVDSLDLLLDSARAGFTYESPIDGVKLELSVEFADKVKVKDAYAEYRGNYLGAVGGFFKAPSTVFEYDGRLSLAKADRGFISEILTDRLEIGGRRPGAAFLAFSHEGLAPRLTLGAFQGSYVADESTRDTELISASVMGAQSVVARVEIEPAPFELGAYGTYRVGTVEMVLPNEEPEHFWAGGADVKLDTVFGSTALRLWLDANVGESWSSESSQSGWPIFIASRLMAAFRFGGIHKGELYAEPYAMGGVLDPDTRVTSDFAYEAALGVNVGFWRQGRLTLEAGLQGTQRNFPDAYVLEFWRDRRSLIAQMAVSF